MVGKYMSRLAAKKKEKKKKSFFGMLAVGMAAM